MLFHSLQSSAAKWILAWNKGSYLMVTLALPETSIGVNNRWHLALTLSDYCRPCGLRQEKYKNLHFYGLLKSNICSIYIKLLAFSYIFTVGRWKTKLNDDHCRAGDVLTQSSSHHNVALVVKLLNPDTCPFFLLLTDQRWGQNAIRSGFV